MAIVLAGVAAFVYVELRRDLYAGVDMDLRSRAQVIVANATRASPSLGGVRRRALVDADEAFAQVIAPDGRVIESTPAVAGAPLVRPGLLAGVRGPTFVDRRPPGLDPARLLVVPARAGGTRRAFVVVGGTLSNAQEALGSVVDLFAVAFPVALGASSLVGWLLAGAALRPVERMRREAEAITASDPSRRLPVPATGDTLARLAVTLNATFDRLQTALERERRFVDDASHELRTPLTVLRAEVDSALSAPRGRDDLEQALRVASDEVEHLVRITEGMLVLARTGDGRLPILRSDTRLADLLAASRQAFAARARAAGLHLEVESPDAVARLDATRVRQAIDNLLDNALHHTPAGGRVRVSAACSGDTVTLVVEDTGPGFDEHVLARAFRPFTRPPAAAYDGSGLGLAIVRAIAAAHGGTATAENLAAGARVTLKLHAPAELAADGGSIPSVA